MGDARTQCRLPDRLSELLDEAAEERGVFRSEVTRRALRYYIGANPDEIEAFSGASAPGIRGVDASNTVAVPGSSTARSRSSRTGQNGNSRKEVVEVEEVEPVEEIGEVEESLVDESESDEDDEEEGMSDGPYDPMEDV